MTVSVPSGANRTSSTGASYTGSSCENPGVPSPLDDAMVAHQIREAMREYAKRVQAEDGQDPNAGIVLNGSGYNYKPLRRE